MSRRNRLPGTKMFVLLSIPDAAEPAMKSALAARNVCATEGRCPDCGCVGRIEPIEPGLFRFVFAHEDGCAVLATVQP